ncbi:MAG: BON domain-containing protein [Pseudomonadota bacterium]
MNKSSTLKSATLIIALAFGSTAMQAVALDNANQDQSPLAAEFKKLDADSNALLNKTEAANDKLFTETNFSEADVDTDGTLSQEEYATYKSEDQQARLKRVASDSLITTKIKTDLLAERDLKSTQITVKTYKGEVILSGFVDNEMSKQKAEVIATKITGVKSVKNSLVVKS